MTIYLDAIWLLNFAVDLMLLMLTKSLLRMNTKFGRMLFGAFIASLFVPISIFYPTSFLTTVTGKLLFSMLIILCTFRIQSIIHFLSCLVTFYFVTFVIGGGLFALHFLFQDSPFIQSTGILQLHPGYGAPVSWLFVILCFPVIYWFTQFRMDKHVKDTLEYDQLCTVTIQMKKRRFQTTGFIDSGNQLIDPITSYPVIVCDEHFLKQWFNEEEWEQLAEAHASIAFDLLPKTWEKYLHVVPYQGVGGSRSFLIAMRPEKVLIDMPHQQLTTNKVLIGIQFASLSSDATYHCLLHPYVIKRAPVQPA